MSKGNKKGNIEHNRELVSRIYAGALNPAEYNAVFQAWDKHFEAIQDVEEIIQKNPTLDFDWADEFVTHFERAGEVIDQLLPHKHETIQNVIAALPYAAFAIDQRGDIQHANSYMENLAKGSIPPSVFDLPLDPDSVNTLRALLNKTISQNKNNLGAGAIIRIFTEDTDEPHILVCETIVKNNEDTSSSLVLIKSISAVWNQDVENALVAAFELTQAETELVGNLYKGLTIKEISDWKGKSQATLRTQLSSILHKTGTKSQSSLARMVVSLVHMISHRNSHLNTIGNPPNLVKDKYFQKNTIELSNGLILEYLEFGDMCGKPVLFIQPTMKPAFSDGDLAKLAKTNVHYIVPINPGAGRTTKAPLSYTPKDWAPLFLEIIDQLEEKEFSCGGHTSGGIYALEIAKLAGPRCKSVLLVDVGAPLKNVRQIYAMHKAPRRLFVAARFFPKALLTPMKYMAADFKSGPDGEARAIEYFFDGSPADQQIIYESKYWNQTRKNLAYAFNNIPKIANDVTYWAQNNTALFKAVSPTSHLRFFHGAENLMMHPKHIKSFCKTTPNTSYNIVPGVGQLLMYVEPDIFVNEIIALAQR